MRARGEAVRARLDLSWPTQPEHIFAHELAGRVRVVACQDQQPILLHSEKWPDYADSRAELRRIKTALGCGVNDALVVVWGPQQDTLTAVEEIRLRYLDATDGIPNETRQPSSDGSTDFERILPGPDRMYPDTDSPPTRMLRDRVARLRQTLPPRPWVREQRYSEAGVPTEITHYLIRRGGAALVDRVVQRCGADLRRACFFFGQRLRGMARRDKAVEAIAADRWQELFDLLAQRPVLWEAAGRLVELAAALPHKQLQQLLQEEGLTVQTGDWDNLVWALVESHHPDHRVEAAGRQRFYMGLIMNRLRGRVPARQVARELDQALAPACTPTSSSHWWRRATRASPAPAWATSTSRSTRRSSARCSRGCTW